MFLYICESDGQYFDHNFWTIWRTTYRLRQFIKLFFGTIWWSLQAVRQLVQKLWPKHWTCLRHVSRNTLYYQGPWSKCLSLVSEKMRFTVEIGGLRKTGGPLVGGGSEKFGGRAPHWPHPPGGTTIYLNDENQKWGILSIFYSHGGKWGILKLSPCMESGWPQ